MAIYIILKLYSQDQFCPNLLYSPIKGEELKSTGQSTFLLIDPPDPREIYYY